MISLHKSIKATSSDHPDNSFKRVLNWPEAGRRNKLLICVGTEKEM